MKLSSALPARYFPLLSRLIKPMLTKISIARSLALLEIRSTSLDPSEELDNAREITLPNI